MGSKFLVRRTLEMARSGVLLMERQDRALMGRFNTRTLVTNGAAVVLYDDEASDTDIHAIMGCVKRYQGDPKILLRLTNSLWDQL